MQKLIPFGKQVRTAHMILSLRLNKICATEVTNLQGAAQVSQTKLYKMLCEQPQNKVSISTRFTWIALTVFSFIPSPRYSNLTIWIFRNTFACKNLIQTARGNKTMFHFHHSKHGYFIYSFDRPRSLSFRTCKESSWTHLKPEASDCIVLKWLGAVQRETHVHSEK